MLLVMVVITLHFLLLEVSSKLLLALIRLLHVFSKGLSLLIFISFSNTRLNGIYYPHEIRNNF